MEIKRNSLHLRLYNVYGHGSMCDLENNRVNFCKYARYVIKGVINAIGFVFLGVVCGLGVIQLVMSPLLWLITDNPFVLFFPPILNDFFFMLTSTISISIIIATLLISIILGWLTLEEKIRKVRKTKEKTDGFFRTWYQSWKEKYCPIVTLENNP